jgi:ATP-binding cassette, subfamily B, bacterial
VKESIGAASNWLTWRTRIKVHYALTEATVGRLHSLPVSFHRAEGVGATILRMDRGIQGLVTALSELAFNLLPGLAYLLMAILVMLKLNSQLALVVLVFAPLPAVIARWAAPEQTRRERNLMDRWARIYARFNEVLSGIVTVKSFAMEDAEKQRFLHDVNQANGVVTRGVGRDSGVGAAQNLIVMLARVAALSMGGFLVLRGEVTVGTLVAFLGYVGGVFTPVQGLSGLYKTVRLASVSMDQIFSILDAQDLLGDAPDACDVEQLKGEVTFEKVHFAYVPNTEPLLDGISLHVTPGETIALVGPSGAGKTTLMAILQRFHPPALPRSRLGDGPGGWARSAQPEAGGPAASHRRGAPGRVAVQREHPGEHCLWKAAGGAGGDRERRSGRPRARVHPAAP